MLRPWLALILLTICLFGFSAFAQNNCRQQAHQHVQNCNNAVDGANGVNQKIGQDGLDQLASQQATQPGGGPIACGTGSSQTDHTTPAAGNMNAAKTACETEKTTCDTECDNMKAQATNQSDKNQDDAGKAECDSAIPAKEAAAGATAGTNTAGATGGQATQSPSCTQAKAPTIPPINPPPSQSADASPTTPTSPTAVPAAATDTPTGSTLLGASDGGSGAGFVGPGGAPGGGSNMNVASAAPTNSGMTPSSISPPSSGSGATGSGSGNGLGMGTASANNTKDPREEALRKALAEGAKTGAAPENQFGNEGGGGGGMGSASIDSSLADYLPGGKKDPSKIRKVAGVTAAANAHPDIVSSNVPLFAGVTKRMRLFCALKELIGCN